MRLSKDLEGKPLVSVSDGRIIGRAKDIFVDKDFNRLAGLFLGSEGVIRRKTMVIRRDDVVLFGVDVVLVKNSEVITNDKDFPQAQEWIRRKDVNGRELRTPGGTKLGTFGDFVLDESGNINALALSRVAVDGPLAAEGTVPRAAIVEAEAEDGAITVDLPKLEVLFGQDKAAAEKDGAPQAAKEAQPSDVEGGVQDDDESAQDGEDELTGDDPSQGGAAPDDS